MRKVVLWYQIIVVLIFNSLTWLVGLLMKALKFVWNVMFLKAGCGKVAKTTSTEMVLTTVIVKIQAKVVLLII